jgi:hypothetical protein
VGAVRECCCRSEGHHQVQEGEIVRGKYKRKERIIKTKIYKREEEKKKKEN